MTPKKPNFLNILPNELLRSIGLLLPPSSLANLSQTDNTRYKFFKNDMDKFKINAFYQSLGLETKNPSLNDENQIPFIANIINYIDTNSPFFNLTTAELLLDTHHHLNSSIQNLMATDIIYEFSNDHFKLNENCGITVTNPAFLLAAIDINILNFIAHHNFSHPWYRKKIQIYIINYFNHYPDQLLPLIFRLAALQALCLEELLELIVTIKEFIKNYIKTHQKDQPLFIILCEQFAYDTLELGQEFYYPASNTRNNTLRTWTADLSSLTQFYKLANSHQDQETLCSKLFKNILNSRAAKILNHPNHLPLIMNIIESYLGEQKNSNYLFDIAHLNNLYPQENKHLPNVFYKENRLKFFYDPNNLITYGYSYNFCEKSTYTLQQLKDMFRIFLNKTHGSIFLDTIEKLFNIPLLNNDLAINNFNILITKFYVNCKKFFELSEKISGNNPDSNKPLTCYLHIMVFHSNIIDSFLKDIDDLNDQTAIAIRDKMENSLLCWGVYCLLENFQSKVNSQSFSNYLLANLLQNSTLEEINKFVLFMEKRSNHQKEIYNLAQLRIESACKITWSYMEKIIAQIKELEFFQKDIDNIEIIFMVAPYIDFFVTYKEFFNTPKNNKMIRKNFPSFIKLFPFIIIEQQPFNSFNRVITFLKTLPANFSAELFSAADMGLLYRNWRMQPDFSQLLVNILATWGDIEKHNPDNVYLITKQLLSAIMQIKNEQDLELLSSLTFDEANAYLKYNPFQDFTDLFSKLNNKLIEDIKNDSSFNLEEYINNINDKRGLESDSDTEDSESKIPKYY